MHYWRKIISSAACLFLFMIVPCAMAMAKEKVRLFVVDSYHREYPWSMDTHKGFVKGLVDLGYLDSQDQAEELTKNDFVESSKAIVKAAWMDAKRKTAPSQKDDAAKNIYKSIKEFVPDLLFLGEDDAADAVGAAFLDTELPVVFWGLNNTPVKYGLVDSMDKPGHNFTGIYESGYYKECLELLLRLAPGAKTFAVLTDDTPVGRSHYKAIENFARQDQLPLQFVETVSTNDFELWKAKALELQNKVDAFFVTQFSALKSEAGVTMEAQEVADWYVKNIKIPEATRGFAVKLGLLCSANDSGFNQGYEATKIAHDILGGAKPAAYPPRTPKRGALMVNKKRAETLGIKLTPAMSVEELVE